MHSRCHHVISPSRYACCCLVGNIGPRAIFLAWVLLWFCLQSMECLWKIWLASNVGLSLENTLHTPTPTHHPLPRRHLNEIRPLRFPSHVEERAQRGGKGTNGSIEWMSVSQSYQLLSHMLAVQQRLFLSKAYQIGDHYSPTLPSRSLRWHI